MLSTVKKYRIIIFVLLLVNFLFTNSYQVYTSVFETNHDKIANFLDKDIDTEKDHKEDEKKEKNDYYLHDFDDIFDEQVKLRLIVLHLDNFENPIFPPFSPPPEIS